MDCIFCKIIKKDLPGKIIYEDDTVISFMDINPVCDGHVLIIPKAHIEDVTKVDDKTIAHMFKISHDIGQKLMAITKEEGYSLSINYGDKQEVKHLHLHIIPNYNKKPTLSYEEIYEKYIANKD